MANTRRKAIKRKLKNVIGNLETAQQHVLDLIPEYLGEESLESFLEHLNVADTVDKERFPYYKHISVMIGWLQYIEVGIERVNRDLGGF